MPFIKMHRKGSDDVSFRDVSEEEYESYKRGLLDPNIFYTPSTIKEQSEHYARALEGVKYLEFFPYEDFDREKHIQEFKNWLAGDRRRGPVFRGYDDAVYLSDVYDQLNNKELWEYINPVSIGEPGSPIATSFRSGMVSMKNGSPVDYALILSRNHSEIKMAQYKKHLPWVGTRDALLIIYVRSIRGSLGFVGQLVKRKYLTIRQVKTMSWQEVLREEIALWNDNDYGSALADYERRQKKQYSRARDMEAVETAVYRYPELTRRLLDGNGDEGEK